MFEAIIFAAAFLLTYVGVGCFRRWSLRKQLFDVPNERSSHTAPTPRGGGAVIVIVCLVFLIGFYQISFGILPWGYLAGASLIATISWLDDLYSISFGWRFLIHSAAAVLVIWQFGFFREVYVPFYGNFEIGIFGAVGMFLWIVWLTNAYNFMDGIDGIAGIQTVTAGIGWFLLGKFFGFETAAFYGGVLAFAAIGFLFHNWQPAKIFMGDVGSAFLGYTFACFPLLLLNQSAEAEKIAVLPLVTVLLVWFFVFDSVFTFLRRLLKKQKVWQAHREHLYQQMVIAGKSHRFVTILYGFSSLILTAAMIFWVKSGRIYTFNLFLILAILTFVIFFLTLRVKSVDVNRE